MISNRSKHHSGIENIIISILMAILCSFISPSLFTSGAQAKTGEINVYLDEAKVVHLTLSRPVSQIIIGNPAISVPMGEIEKEGKKLPLGLQILADFNREALMCKLAEDFTASDKNLVR